MRALAYRRPRRGLGDIPPDGQDGQDSSSDFVGAGGYDSAGAAYDPNVESMTVSADSYSSDPGYSSDPSSFDFSSADLPPDYFSNFDAYGNYQDPNIENVTVTDYAPAPQDVQAPDFSLPDPSTIDFSSAALPADYFDTQYGNLDPNITTVVSDAPAAAPIEDVTVSAVRDPVQQLVQANAIPDYLGPAAWDPTTLWPDLPDDTAPQKTGTAAKPAPLQPQRSSGGGASGGGSSGGQQQKPIQQVFNFPKPSTGNNIFPIFPGAQQQAAQRLTPAQQAALDQLSPAQLAQLLRSGQLTPAQSQAVQQALARKLAAPVSAGGGGLSPAAAQKVAAQAAAASPFQSKAALLPALLIGGVIAAYAATHHQQISKQVRVSYASAKRRASRLFA